MPHCCSFTSSEKEKRWKKLMTISMTSLCSRGCHYHKVSLYKSYKAVHWNTSRSKLSPTQICCNSVFISTAQNHSTLPSLHPNFCFHQPILAQCTFDTFTTHNFFPTSPVKVCTFLRTNALQRLSQLKC